MLLDDRARGGDLANLEKALESGGDPNATDWYEACALSAAASRTSFSAIVRCNATGSGPAVVYDHDTG